MLYIVIYFNVKNLCFKVYMLYISYSNKRFELRISFNTHAIHFKIYERAAS
jgi:hypothetical protein